MAAKKKKAAPRASKSLAGKSRGTSSGASKPKRPPQSFRGINLSGIKSEAHRRRVIAAIKRGAKTMQEARGHRAVGKKRGREGLTEYQSRKKYQREVVAPGGQLTDPQKTAIRNFAKRQAMRIGDPEAVWAEFRDDIMAWITLDVGYEGFEELRRLVTEWKRVGKGAVGDIAALRARMAALGLPPELDWLGFYHK